jgi:hypothetical protein
MGNDGVTISLDARVREGPQRNAGLSWTLALDHRVDELVKAAIEAGENTSRKELVSAILADFVGDPAELGRVLKAYRMMSVGQLLRDDGSSDVVRLLPNGPGPRKRRAAES